MTLDELLKELKEQHIAYFHIYGHNIPSSKLSFTASEYLEVLSRERSLESAYKNSNKIIIAEVLYKDFVDPQGEDEMTKLLQGII